jgi:hypothetical protein
MGYRLAACLISLMLLAPAAWADTLHVIGAGSLATAFAPISSAAFPRAPTRSQRRNSGPPA